ncbi:MAG: glycoside hydrolase family 2 protein, partial [Flavobacteriales bacterium]|nr:glycoside hydrolase family 2 protein [Flavobacteriales bacterium]
MRYLLIIMLAISPVGFGQKILSWSILHPVKKEWIELGEKGSVQEALIATGELPNPFDGLNENKFGWIEDHQWEFKSMFFLEKEEVKRDFIELHFPSLDTYAKVFLNDSLIYTGNNAFYEHTIRLKDHLKKGLNELTVVFTPPVMHHKAMYDSAAYHLPAPNDNHSIAIAPYTRKPQYQFGWDWALRMNTIGLNKAAWIEFSDFGHITSKTTRIVSVTDEKAVIEFDILLSNEEVHEIVWKSKSFGTENVKRKNGVFTRRVEVENPKLWWPKGQGEAFLYRDEVEIETVKKQEVSVFRLKFGIKTSELITEKDEWGTSYYFKINGRTIFCKGGDYIPQDIFPARVKDEDIERMVEIMAESNFNMVRVWGGGYYPDEVFFDKCDELGIMVWEDLMFACAMYPGDDAFIENISKEFRVQIPRIAAHPSVVLFNGNNEVEVAWGNWGFQIKYGLYGKSAKEIERSYDRVFKETAPNIIKEFTGIPYIHTSPLSNWGKDDLYNHGSQHYWGVWHGKDPMEDFGKKIGRFNAEYGFQSFPEYNTLLTFSDTTQWDLSSDVMKHHQKSYVGNDMILKHAKRLYGKPETFEDFVYYSQLTQAKAVSMAVAGHRIDFPRCGGTLYWQVNDCWPAPTWSS